MRLKQLKISGFKSFADSTVIEFPSAVSGIVGPNGCGKSNVIDAIRWVLGEARVSELRGSSSMSELIFAGSSNRPAASRASVEMVLDNTDGTVAGPWGRYSEISVKRIVTRDGTNAYLLNNQQVRRRDVQDIFLGTGLGPRSYAIISQGMISNFIKAKPEELRVYLEEAAGVSKYKERRKETESALNTTRSNLEKVAYLQETKRSEVERLTQEAEVAQKWQELESERTQTELLWYFVQERDARNAIDTLNARISNKEADLITGQGEAHSLVVQIDQLREQANQRRKLADDARENAWQMNSRVTEIEGNIRHIVERKDSIAHQIATATEAIERHRRQQDESAARIHALQEQVQGMLDRSEADREEASGLEEELAERQAHYDDARASYEQARAEATSAENDIGIAEVRMQAIGREIAELERRLEALKAESRSGTVPDEARCADLAERIEQNTAAIEDESAWLEENLGIREESRMALENCQEQKLGAEQLAARLSERLQTLIAVQQQAQAEGALPDWLEKMGLGGKQRFFESLEVDPAWAVALEAILTVKAAALPVSRLQTAAGFAFDTPPARLVFYATDSVELTNRSELHDRGLIPLSRYIHAGDLRVEPVMLSWLSGVYCVSDLADAVSQRDKLSIHEKIVTQQGHIVDSVSISFWAEEGQSSGLLTRAMEIKKLDEDVHASRERAQQASLELVQAKARFNELDVQIRTKQNLLNELRNRTHTLELEHSSLAASLQAWKTRRTQIQQEETQLNARAEELVAEQETSEEQFESLDEILSVKQQAVTDCQVLMEQAENAVTDLEERVRELNASARLAQMQASTTQERIVDVQRAAQRAQEEIYVLSEDVELLRSQLEELDETAEREGLSAMLSELELAKERQSQTEVEWQEAEKSVEEARTRYQTVTEAQAPLLQEISDLKVKRQAYSTQTEVFTQRLEELKADRMLLAQIVDRDALKSSGLKAKVGRLTEAIAALGPVNHAALENLEASRRAVEETQRQVADLESAIANLESTIRKIDAETRSLLKSTFEQVNENFGAMFTGLFGGGAAELRMSGDEILESGVEVIAQPPGKKNASVRLLSGGEQAMTATALVFAIFQLNPAPFCLLDEVDAPLDEANQDRLARKILAMSDNTQFMMITHHRVTMELMRQLVGVTMKEPGVSRVVSVDVEQASSMIATT